MSSAFALFTSDPNLLGCEVDRLKSQVALLNGERYNTAGVGSFAQEGLLLRLFASHQIPRTLSDLIFDPLSEALLYHAGALPLGASAEENGQPFRYQRWLFCHVGSVQQYPLLKPKLLAELPDHLRRHLQGDTDSEAAFLLFLKELKDAGRIDGQGRDPAPVVHALAETTRRLKAYSAEVGAARTSALDFIVSNQRMLVATRAGEVPLHYTLLEGFERCDRCKITSSTPETNPKARAHRRCRSLAVATHLSPKATGWIEIEDHTAIAVDASLKLSTHRV